MWPFDILQQKHLDEEGRKSGINNNIIIFYNIFLDYKAMYLTVLRFMFSFFSLDSYLC